MPIPPFERPTPRPPLPRRRVRTVLATVALLVACASGPALEDPSKPPPQEFETLRCASESGGYATCPARNRIARAEIAEEESRGACKVGHTWGFTGTDVWVDGGCRATFRVYPARRAPRRPSS
jgi:hypothetical protein